MNLAQLGIVVTTTGAEKGAADLDRLGDSADHAKEAATGVGPAYQRVGQEVQASANAARNAAGVYATQAQQIRAATLSAKQYSQSLRMLPAQITDIVTGLASGQSPFIVAIQQGGQLRDSFGGFGNTLRALSTIITPTRLALGLLGGTVAGVVKAYNDAENEAFELTRAIAMSGNAAGVTSGQLALMAEGIDDIVGTRGAAAETLAALAASGRVAGDNIERFGVQTQQILKGLGQPVEETVKILTELGRSPVDAAVKLNEKVNFLTESMYEQILAAERRGDVEEAGALAQSAYLDEFQRRAKGVEGELPVLAAAARATGSAFKEMWDGITGAFLPVSPEKQLAKMREERGNRPLFGGRAEFDINLFATDQQEQALAQSIEAAQRRAEEQAEQARRVRAKERERAELQSRLQSQRTVDEAVSSARSAALQRERDDSVAQYAAYEAQLDAERDAGLISEEDYYSERRRLINQHRDAQIVALQTESQLLEAQRARIQTAAQAEAGNARNPAERIRLEAQAQAALIANQTKILANQTKIAQLRGQEIAELSVLATQQKAANKDLEDSYTDARQAAEDFLRTIERRQQRQLDGLGQGDRAREISNSRSDIDDRFADQRIDLAAERRRGDITEEQYQRQLEIIDEFHQRALDSTDEYYADLGEKQGSFFVGAQEAVANYLDSAANVAELTNQALTNAFQGAEDALIQFVQTGKFNFKDFANSVIADILRIQIRALAAQALTGMFGGIFGVGAGSIGGTGAGGGIATPGFGDMMFADTGIKRVPRDNQPVLLHKDEAVLPAAMNPWAGGKGVGGPGITVNQTFYPAPGNNVAQLHALLEQSKQEVISEIAENLHRGRWAGVAS